jgi:hypothetical protein
MPPPAELGLVHPVASASCALSTISTAITVTSPNTASMAKITTVCVCWFIKHPTSRVAYNLSWMAVSVAKTKSFLAAITISDFQRSAVISVW